MRTAPRCSNVGARVPVGRKLVQAMIVIGSALLHGGCTYLHYASVQKGYAADNAAAPGQWYAKHLLGSDTYIVYGRLLETPSLPEVHSAAVIAVSDRYRPDEIVETCRLGQSSTYFGMKLPAGEFRLLVVADRNGNGVYDSEDVVAERLVHLDRTRYPDRVAGHLDIVLEPAQSRPSDRLIAALPRPIEPDARDSLFFPKGTIRTLDDAIFSEEIAAMGIYDPAAFVETAPMMFYALEEDISYKVPVVFVHGIGGSPRQFAALVQRLDRTRYKPWFFHYPSGEDLDQLARLFHDIFLSGRVIPDEGAPMVIVAHSMGGLVVREAMNLGTPEDRGAPVAMIVTLASPFGGDPSARLGAAKAPIVPPAWRDLDPAGPFIGGLFRRPLRSGTQHQLIYAYRKRDDIARGTDGVVPLERQLPAAAMNGATRIQGFKAEHTAILTDRTAVDAISALIAGVQSPLPADHLNLLRAGGFGVALGDTYTARERFLLDTYGRYLRALANGTVQPLYPEQRHFIAVARGDAAPENDAESAWLKFRAAHPGPAAAETP